jgi:hypothetical protein
MERPQQRGFTVLSSGELAFVVPALAGMNARTRRGRAIPLEGGPTNIPYR